MENVLENEEFFETSKIFWVMTNISENVKRF